MIKLAIPYPPSGNHIWKHAGGRHYLTKKAIEFYGKVKYVVTMSGGVVNLDMPLTVTCRLHPPDKRRRDLDNAWKTIADSLTKAGVWQDDRLVRRLVLEWADPVQGGQVFVSIAQHDEIPLTC